MNNIIKLAFISAIALSAVACDNKAPQIDIKVVTPETSNPVPQPPAVQQPQTSNPVAQPPAAVQPQTSNPIAQPDALEKAKQVEGIMKKDEATQKQAIDAK